MLLPYGKNAGRLTHISEVPSGHTNLQCPYCEANLIAKKGKQNAHHFAHIGKSCLSSGSASLLDVGKKLATDLSITEHSRRKQGRIQQALLKHQKQVRFLSKKDAKNKELIKILVAYLKAQQPPTKAQAVVAYVRYEFEAFPRLHHLAASFSPHIAALQAYHRDKQQLAEAQDKLALFQQELAWFHSFQLYFLEIRTGSYSVFYKIGLTARKVSERIQEIRQDLKQFPKLDIQVLYVLKGQAFLETFFKQKYRNQRYELGQHTEYFAFEYYELEAIKQALGRLESRSL